MPEIKISFTGQHKHERAFATLDGDVLYKVIAQDNSKISKIIAIAPKFETNGEENIFGPLSINHVQNAMEVCLIAGCNEIVILLSLNSYFIMDKIIMKIQMLKLSVVLYFSVFSCQLLFADFVTIDDDHYYDDIAGTPFRLILERLKNDNYGYWKNLADFQDTYGFAVVSSIAREKNQTLAGHPQDAFGHFKQVIDKVNRWKNEIYIAYVTDNKKLPQEKNDSLQDSILYCMTVVTSPEALITSHMGIGKTIDGYRKDVKNMAVLLHSFAAEIMLQKKKDRRFMINAPAWVMESIIADSLKEGGLYVGTRESFARLKEIGDIAPNKARATPRGQEIEAQIKKTNPNISDEALKKEIISEFFAAWYDVPVKGGKMIPFFEFREKYPPIISIEAPVGQRLKQMTVFEGPSSDEVFLEVSRGDPESLENYQWMFTEPFAPGPGTHYIAVDLEKLAKARK